MATPNIVNATSINGFNVCGAVTTSAVDIIDVAADKLYKINTLLISNVDGSSAADVTVSVSNDNGSNYYHIAKTISVPADSTLTLLSTDLYLDETDLLRVQASANSDLEYVVSGVIIDDA
tara:strand:- start:841 stop:1200 length:360 start_codon:yes stop_codon:yes gene_type:complete